jgi:hypothetical protein
VGYGATSCSHFLQDYQGDPLIERVYFAWAQGYLSALLITRPPGVDENLDLTPVSFNVLTQMEYVRTYCRSNPTVGYSVAIEALYRQLKRVEREQH